MKYILNSTNLILLLLASVTANCQLQKDTIHNTPRNNIFHYAMHFLKKNSKDTISQQGLLTTKSETVYQPFEGKIIRHIVINQYKFERTFTDTTNSSNYFGTRILNTLHNTTKEWAIRNNLFIKENTPVSGNLLADNERFLRTLPYIQDARIIIQPKTGSPDSVDVYVITKDLFTINAQLHNGSTKKFRASVEDDNLFAIAQRLRIDFSWEKDRAPATGFGVYYTKYNIAHSFADASIGYSTIRPDLRDGTRDERAVQFSLTRNLVSQYTHFAGGINIGDFTTFNYYHKPEFLFYDYHYRLYDFWLGYNLGVKNYLSNKSNLNRQFVSLRYYKTDFLEKPLQSNDKLFFRFDNKQAILGQYTFFRQQFYKTNYLYGFGVTEDLPYGYNIALTGGWYKQAYLSRPYAGVDANWYVLYDKGDIIQYFIRASSFWNKGNFQDAGILTGISGFSRAFLFRNLKVRQYFLLSYARIFNRTGLDPLSINNPFGIRNFNRDSVMGNQRISLHSETISFINYKVFGFKFSPFLLGDVAAISPRLDRPDRSSWYYGLGGGVRMRNENLVFNTTELKFVYFPHTSYGMKSLYVSLSTNISFRYNNNYVQEPDIIQYNSDYQNNIY